MTNIASPVFHFRAAALAVCLLLPPLASAAPPVAGPNVNMVSGTRFPEGDPFLTKQNEPSIAVSSRNPRHLLAASNDYRQVAVLTAEGLKGGKAWNTLYKSVDGGTSWRSVVLGGCPLDIPACNDATGLTAPLKALAPDFSADPTVRSGPHGTFFYTFIAGRRDGSADGVVGIQRFVDKNNNIQRDTDVRTINGQDVVKWAEDPIIPDAFNIIDRGTSGQFIDKPWNAADIGGRSWNAGKTCELLSWTKSKPGVVTPAAETVPAFSVYVSYALFAGTGNNEHPTVYVAASQDCGNTFDKPVKVSNSLDANSGTSMVVNPLTGTVYVVWRRFGSLESPAKPDEIYVNKSSDGGKTWLNQAVRVAQFIPYDQAATGGSFRTLAFPSVAVSVDGSGKSRVHVAFTARGAAVGTLPPYACQSTNPRDCDARIKIATSIDGGLTWSAPADADPIPSVPTNPADPAAAANPDGRGHQVQPALTFSAGKLFLTWLDQRFDQTEEVLECPVGVTCTAGNLVPRRVAMGNLDPNCKVDVGSDPLASLSQQYKELLGPAPGACYEYRPGRPSSVWTTYLTDGTPGLVRRHTVDVFAAMAAPADTPVFASSRISQYLFGSTSKDAEGKYQIRQKELFAPNLPLFVNGGAAFVGDYIDAAGQIIVATGDPDPADPTKYRYKFNVGSCATAACAQFTTGGLSPVFHVAHTDNRNVIPPVNGDWTTPTCLATAFTGDPTNPTTNYGTCATPGYAGNRNQDVFSTIVSEGSLAYANANSKALGAKPRGFVVTVDNLDSNATRSYRLQLPSGVTASFDKGSFDTTLSSPPAPVPYVDVDVQPRSSATRSAWVLAGTSASNARVVVQVTSPPGCDPSGGAPSCAYSSQVALNPDPGAADSLVGSGDGASIDDIANNDLGNVVLSNAVLTNNVLSNNALTNNALTNNALTNAALTNVVLSNAVLSNLQVENAALTNNALTNAVLSNVVLTNAALTNVVLTNAELGNVVLSNNVLSNATPEAAALTNAVLTNNALTNVALTNIDPANVALSNAALTNNALTNVALTNNALTNVMLTNAALTNAALTNVVLSNNALSNNALSNNALSNNALSNNALSNSALSDDLKTVEAANPDLGKNDFTADDLSVSDFLDATFTVRNRGNTDTTLAVKLLLRDADCTTAPCALPPGVKLQLVMRKITLIPTAIPPTGPAVDTGRALRLGLVQANAQVSNVGVPEIVDPAAGDLGRFLPSKANAATLPLSPGERAYVTLRAVGATAGFNLTEFLRWGVKTVVVDANNTTLTRIPLIIKTLTVPAVTAGRPASVTLAAFGGLKTAVGATTVAFSDTAPPVCTDSVGNPASGAACPASFAGGAFADDGTNTQTSTGQLQFTPPVAGTFYVLVTVKDTSVPPQEDRQLLKVVVNSATPVVTIDTGNPNFPTEIPFGQPFDLGVLLAAPPLITSSSPEPITFATDPNAATVCTVSGTMLTPVGLGTCTFLVQQGETLTYTSISVTSPPIPVVPGPQAISVTAPAAKTYGDGDFALSASGGGSGNPVTFNSLSTGVCTVSASTVHIVSAGDCNLTADQAASTNYLAAPQVAFTVKINRRQVTVTADARSKTYGAADPALTYQVTGGALVGSDVFTGALTRAAGESVGSYPILQGSLALGTNYALTYVGANLTITARAITVTAEAKTKVYGVADPALTYQITSGALVGGDGFTGALSRVAGEDVGSYPIQQGTLALGSGYALNFTGATLTIGKANQTITFPPVTAPTFSAGGTFGVSASANSGLTVSFGTSTPGACTVSGSTVTMVSAGSCTLTATQGGDANYNPASPVGQSFTIPKATQTIAFNPSDTSFGTAPFQITATASSGLAVTFALTGGSCAVAGTGSPPAAPWTVTLTSTGTCTITASQGGDGNFQPAPDVTRTFAIDLQDVYNSVGTMGQPRSYHTATRFDSGQLAGWVLVAGGLDASGAATATSELYNPVTRTFSPTGNMPSKAVGHSATLLRCGTAANPCANNGKVLALGGGNSSAEIYDPVARTWTPAGSLSSTRSYHTATVLGDGTNRVLVSGGADNSGKSLNTTILYNPSNGTFANGPTMKAVRERHTATLLPNGKVLIVGGRQKSGGGYSTVGSAEICDATVCTLLSSAMSPRHSHAAVALPNGTVLLTGGANDTTDLATAEILDPATGNVSPAGTLGTGRRELTATGLPNGRAVVAGGQTGTTPKSASDLYQPPVAPGAPMKAARTGHTATPLKDAAGNVVNVLIIGGASGSPAKSVSSAELYGWFGP